MQRFTRTVALSVLGVSLGSLDLVVWFLLRLPLGIDSTTLEVNHILLPWQLLVRCVITGILVWTFLYFRAHCVVANREETKVITRG